MLNQLTRPEEVSIKNDIHEIAKSLATIALSIPNTTTEKTELYVKDGDPFFGKIHISNKHLDALREEYSYKPTLSEVGLMEECSELTQALSKRIRAINSKKDNIIEEMAHVITCMRLVCFDLKIKPEDIQKEIMKKYPEGYRDE